MELRYFGVARTLEARGRREGEEEEEGEEKEEVSWRYRRKIAVAHLGCGKNKARPDIYI